LIVRVVGMYALLQTRYVLNIGHMRQHKGQCLVRERIRKPCLLEHYMKPLPKEGHVIIWNKK